MKYRRDIDGLRAVAVVAVILSHAGFSLFSGGFVGVDVFFVISGYLITGILLGEMATGTYSLRRFYQRRARRILPALILVMVVCFPFACVLMLPDYRQNFGQSVVATTLFANNVLLAITSGYWELESAFKPLLHTWSLGVEEQFYIAFPLMLAVVWRFGRRWQLVAIAIVGVVSLGCAEYGWRVYPAASFYLPMTRAWELMVGCAAAYVKRRERTGDGILAGIGLVAILAATLFYDEHIPSPSVYMLLPVLGTAAVLLFNRPETFAFRFLSMPVAVGIGLISYSAYLWHQPLMAFTRIASLEPPSRFVISAAALMSFPLAYLSWRFVEVPFRSRERISWPVFMWPVVGISVLLVASGLYLHVRQGIPELTFPNIESGGDVYISYNERIHKFSASSFGETSGRKVLVIGNSLARDVANVLIEAGAMEGNKLVYVETRSGAADKVVTEAAELLRAADILVFAIHGKDDFVRVTRWISNVEAHSRAQVIIFGPKDFGWNLNPYGRLSTSARAAVLSKVPDTVVNLNEALLARFGTGEYVDVLRLLGEDGRRISVFDGRGNPVSPDRIHLTKYGARLLAQRLKEKRPDVLALFRGTSGAQGEPQVR